MSRVVGPPDAPGPSQTKGDLRAGVLLLLICAVAAMVRFTGLSWGAPYFHFHIDEHFVFQGADMLRRSLREASMSPKFFMYGPLPMWILGGVAAVHDRLFSPLILTVPRDEITYMVMGRAISAALGTACVPLVYLVARRVAGRTAGLIAALLLACAVVHLRESHFFSVDISMLFFTLVAWLFALRMVETGRLRDYVLAGLGLGAAVSCKYTALFLVPVLGLAHLCAPGRPGRLADVRGWVSWTARGVTPLVTAAVVFAAIDPMAIMYFAKFWGDIDYWVVGVNSGAWRPIFMAQFTDIQVSTSSSPSLCRRSGSWALRTGCCVRCSATAPSPRCSASRRRHSLHSRSTTSFSAGGTCPRRTSTRSRTTTSTSSST